MVTKGTPLRDLRLRHVAEETSACPYTASERRSLPSDPPAFTCIPRPTSIRWYPRVCAQLPVIALGSGVTLASVLNVLRWSGLDFFAVCPPQDFVRRSRWYRPLATALPNPGPSDLQALLETSEINSAVLLPCSDDWLRAVTSLPTSLSGRFPSSTSPHCVDILTNKWRFAQLLEKFGIPRPRTQLISSREQCHPLPDSLFEGAILKPLSSVDFACRHGVKGYLVESRREAAALIEQLELPIMLQEFIPGPPHSGYFPRRLPRSHRPHHGPVRPSAPAHVPSEAGE